MLMKYCNHCRVHIRGNKKECPLCRNILPEDTGDTYKNNRRKNANDEIYPEIPPTYERHLAVRVIIFISVVVIVASFVVYQLFPHIFPTDVNWPLFVLFGIISMWLSLTLVIRKRNNITKNITWQVAVVSLLSVFWDWRTGWGGWSLDYVIPVICVAAMLVMYVTAKVMKLSVRDYITYFLLDSLLGIIPILFIIFRWVRVVYPSLISVAVSIIFLSAIIIFQGENIKAELNKRMHI